MGGADHVSSGRYWPVTSVRRGHDNDYENGRDAQPLWKTSLLHILSFQKVCFCYKRLSLYPCSGPFLQQQQQQSLRSSWAWWTLGFGIGLYGTGCSCWTEERQTLRLTLRLNKPQDNLNPALGITNCTNPMKAQYKTHEWPPLTKSLEYKLQTDKLVFV